MNSEDLNPQSDDYATRVVDRILQSAIAAGASDIHLAQLHHCIGVRFRVDGSLVDVGNVADGASASILGRLKALAGLITYRKDVPQEGRLKILPNGNPKAPQVEARLGTLPTLHGERAVIRLTMGRSVEWLPEQLGLPEALLERLTSSLALASGVILITGPAGSGKTTTAYAAVRQILKATKPRCIVTLEDPVESEIEGTSQSQIAPAVGFDWSAGLKALLRQDPEVMLVGEIRDPETAAVVFQAAMTGQLVLSTMHARSTADALRRLLDMNVPAHHLRSSLDLLLCQRLLPKHCKCISQPSDPASCNICGGTGRDGRLLIAEALPTIEGELARSLVQDADSRAIASIAKSLGMQSLGQLASEAVNLGQVPQADVLHSL